MENETTIREIDRRVVADDEIEIDLLALAREYLKHWKMIVVTMLLCGVVSFSFSKFLITPMYASTSRLYVLTKSTSITSLADIQTGGALAADYLDIVNSRPVLDQVIKKLHLDMDYKSLKSKVTVENPSNTRILNITVTDENPNTAKRIADCIAGVSASFISQKMDQDPPSIIQNGYADQDKVSPNTKKNTLIAMVLGFVLVCGYLTVMYLVNDTIETPEDVENKLGMQVLGSLPLETNEEPRRRRRFRKKRR